MVYTCSNSIESPKVPKIQKNKKGRKTIPSHMGVPVLGHYQEIIKKGKAIQRKKPKKFYNEVTNANKMLSLGLAT